MCEYCYVICAQPQSSVGTYKAPIKTLQQVLPNRLQLRLELASRATRGLEARMMAAPVTPDVKCDSFDTKDFFCNPHGASSGSFKHPKG